MLTRPSHHETGRGGAPTSGAGDDCGREAAAAGNAAEECACSAWLRCRVGDSSVRAKAGEIIWDALAGCVKAGGETGDADDGDVAFWNAGEVERAA